MPTRLEDDLAVLYADALHHLTAILHAPGATHADREHARDALMRLHNAYSSAGMKNLDVRAAELNALASTLHGVGAMIEGDVSPLDIDALRESAEQARLLLVRAAREAFPDAANTAPPKDDPNATIPDTDAPKPDRSGTSNPPVQPSQPGRVEAGRRAEYDDLFATCIERPDKIANVNWYAGKLLEYKERYERIGAPLSIPWWFIGAIHGLESGFAFDRHLHNGDPLTARTKRVPPNRPTTGEPPFAWEDSARDALQYMRLDQWGDWSVSGALYQWEAYNGFGYRKYNIHTPYLWSFSNHYDKGRYVRDFVFDTDAVSNQCGAATLLRALVNKGAVAV